MRKTEGGKSFLVSQFGKGIGERELQGQVNLQADCLLRHARQLLTRHLFLKFTTEGKDGRSKVQIDVSMWQKPLLNPIQYGLLAKRGSMGGPIWTPPPLKISQNY